MKLTPHKFMCTFSVGDAPRNSLQHCSRVPTSVPVNRPSMLRTVLPRFFCVVIRSMNFFPFAASRCISVSIRSKLSFLPYATDNRLLSYQCRGIPHFELSQHMGICSTMGIHAVIIYGHS